LRLGAVAREFEIAATVSPFSWFAVPFYDEHIDTRPIRRQIRRERETALRTSDLPPLGYTRKS